MNTTIIPNAPFEKEIVEVLNILVEVLEQQHVRFAHLEGHVAELSKRASHIVVKMPKNRKVLPFLVGAATGVYVYRTFVQSKISVDLKDKDGAVWSYQKAKGEEKVNSATPPENQENPDAAKETITNEDLVR